jgi:uncharacterized phage infection (PIP) family protein YhgE
VTKDGPASSDRRPEDVCCRDPRQVRRLQANLVRAAQDRGQTSGGVSDPADHSELSERVDALAAWIKELDAQLHASTAVGDSKTLKELAKALEAWNKHDPKLEERVTNRVDVLADRLATLAGTVNVTAAALAGKDGEIANLRRELQEGTARIEAVVRELRESGSGRDVAELRNAVAELSRDRKSRSSDKQVEAISGDVDVLAQRLDTLSKTVSTTAAGLAGREGELASLRARLEEGDARAVSLVGELRESLEALSRHVAGLGDRSRDPQTLQLFTSRLDDLTAKVEQLAKGLGAVSTSVATATESLTATELELTAVNRRFEEASARVDGMIRELHETVASLPDTGSIDAEVDERLQALGRQVDGVAEHLSQLEAAIASRWDDQAAAATAEVEQLVGEVSRRLAELERDRDAATSELDRSTEAWAEERTWVRGQLDALASALAETQVDESVEPKLQELASRLAAIEAGHAAVEAEVARVAELWGAARDELRSELDALATTLSAQVVSGATANESAATEEFLAELAKRLDAMEREGTAAAAEIARREAFWAAEIGSLETRIDEIADAAVEAAPAPADRGTELRVEELARRIEAIERDRSQAATGSAAEAEELRDIRVLMNGLRMRLASSEKELAALSNSGDVVSRLDDISLRLGSLERSNATFQSAPAPVPGDGRFRVELRGLELRMEQLEAAARENRDAVLMQFERLASRLQWRLQQLELESADAGYSTKAAPKPLGQVVPIRGDA